MRLSTNVIALAVGFVGIVSLDVFAVERFVSTATSTSLPAWALVLVAILGLGAHIGLLVHAVKTLKEILASPASRKGKRRKRSRRKPPASAGAVEGGARGAV